MPAQAELIIKALGAKEASKDIGLIDSAVLSARKQVEAFKKTGGLAALAVGGEKIEAAEKQVEALAVSLVNANAELIRLNTELKTSDPGSDNYVRLQTQIAETEAKAASLRAEIKKLPRDLREEVTQTAGFLGDIDTSLATLAGSISGIGASPIGRIAGQGLQQGLGPLSGAGAGLQVGADIFAAAEALPRLSAALGTLKANTLAYIAPAAQQAVANSALAASAASATGGVGTLTGGVVALTIATGPALLAFAAVSAAFLVLKARSDDAREAYQKQADAERQRVDNILEQQEILNSMTADDIQTRIDQIEYERRLRTESLEKARNDLAEAMTLTGTEAEKDLREIAERAGDVFHPLDASIALWNEALGVHSSEVSAAKDEIEDYNEQIKTQTEELNNLNAALKEAQTTQFFNDKAQEKIREQQEIAEFEEWRTSIIGQSSEAISENITELERQNQRLLDANKALEGSAEGYRETGQEEAAASLQAQIDANTAAYDKNIIKLEYLTTTALKHAETVERETKAIEANNQALEKANSEYNKLSSRHAQLVDELGDVDKQLKEIADTQARNAARELELEQLKSSQRSRESGIQAKIDAAKAREQQKQNSAKIQEINQDGFEKEQAKLKDLGKEEQKAEAELNKSITEIQREGLKAKRDYEREKAQIERDAEAQLLQAKADRDVVAFERLRNARDERLAGLDSEQQEQARQRDQRIADLRVQFQAEQQERRIAGQQAIQEIRSETVARVQAAREAGRVVVSEVAQLEQQLAELRGTFAQEEAALRARFAQDDRARQVAALQERQRLLQQEINQTTMFMRLIAATITATRQSGTGLANYINNIISMVGRLPLVLGGGSNNNNTSTPNAGPRKFGLGAFAEGGIKPPGLAMVGEKGRELVFSNEKMAVLNNRATEAFMAGMSMGRGGGLSGGVHISFAGANFGAVATPGDLAVMRNEIETGVVEGIRKAGIDISARTA